MANCNPGEKAVSGGVSHGGGNFGQFHFVKDEPTTATNPTGWMIEITNTVGSDVMFRAIVVCASP